ncbi:MAG: MFS transporter, partial [Deltaproteobacteria bacterium]|nr:MFS transporter [Deltaproteobacteria bacterium]
PMTDEIIKNKATRIDLFSLKTPQMRAFHMSWFAFFLCFFAWFGIAPLMVVVRDELGLTKTQVGNTIIASVAVTIVARLAIGWLCDRIGPRITYTWLLLIGSLPVMTIGFADSYYSFLLFRLAIGVIGASATSAGWGNLGGGVTQMIMPLIFAAFVGLGYSDFWSWRLSMTVAGIVCFGTGIAYYFFTTDLPNGNFKELRASGEYHPPEKIKGSFREAAKDKRVWALFFVYAACFGVELTLNNIAALYYTDYFGLGLKTAGLVAGLFGLMNIFARTTGGIIGDKFAARWGLKGRVKWLFIALFVESLALMFFSRMTILPVAIGSMVVFSLFVQMSEGATYSVVPFINKKALGSVAGIVGAGGNAGAVAAGFLFRAEKLTWPTALLILGGAVMVCSFATLAVTFSPAAEKEAKREYDKALADRRAAELERAPAIPRPALPELLGSLRPIAVLRIYLGVALAIKGIYFIMNMDAFEQLSGTLGDLPTVVAWYVVAAHVVGGAALAIGLGTRFAALVNIPVLIGAILAASSGGLFASDSTLQFTMFVLLVLALFVWQGSGKFSVDPR